MKFTKTRKVKSPSRGTSKSAGIDFFVPEDFEEIELKPNEEVLICSGIKCNIPDNYVLLLLDKSGISLKGLAKGGGVIDCDYEGELKFIIYNRSLKNVSISPNQKIIQGLLIPIFMDILEEVEENLLFSKQISERGEGGFGSTGVY